MPQPETQPDSPRVRCPNLCHGGKEYPVREPFQDPPVCPVCMGRGDVPEDRVQALKVKWRL